MRLPLKSHSEMPTVAGFYLFTGFCSNIRSSTAVESARCEIIVDPEYGPEMALGGQFYLPSECGGSWKEDQSHESARTQDS